LIFLRIKNVKQQGKENEKNRGGRNRKMESDRDRGSNEVGVLLDVGIHMKSELRIGDFDAAANQCKWTVVLF
jgi:hypothetical protein